MTMNEARARSCSSVMYIRITSPVAEGEKRTSLPLNEGAQPPPLIVPSEGHRGDIDIIAYHCAVVKRFLEKSFG